jgi:hypothetical protein
MIELLWRIFCKSSLRVSRLMLYPSRCHEAITNEIFLNWSIARAGSVGPEDESSNDSFTADCEFLLSTVFPDLGPSFESQACLAAVEATPSWATPATYNSAALNNVYSQPNPWPPTRFELLLCPNMHVPFDCTVSSPIIVQELILSAAFLFFHPCSFLSYAWSLIFIGRHVATPSTIYIDCVPPSEGQRPTGSHVVSTSIERSHQTCDLPLHNPIPSE